MEMEVGRREEGDWGWDESNKYKKQYKQLDINTLNLL